MQPTTHIVLGTLLLVAVSFAFRVSSRRTANAEEAPSKSPVTTSTIAYTHDEVELEGYLARPAEGATKHDRAAVLIVHAWRGHGDFVRERAKRLAQQGYIAFALDMYGKGVLAKDNAEAAKLAGPFYAAPSLMRGRAKAGLNTLLTQDGVDAKRVAAIGFCFGGTTVLEMARAGMPLAGVVSFHGGLKTKQKAAPGTIRARVLVAHGGDDPYVPAADVLAFWQEMQEAKADHQILILSDAVHAFTDPAAGDDASKGAAYSKAAADRSFAAMNRFFREILAAG